MTVMHLAKAMTAEAQAQTWITVTKLNIVAQN